jgi:spermidine synthase
VAAIPVYVGGHLAMGFATDNTKARQASAKMIAARYKKAGGFATQYWTPELHVGAFAQPRFIADLVAKARAKKGAKKSTKPRTKPGKKPRKR